MFEDIYIVYIRIDDANRVTEVNSSAFISDCSGWIEIDSGDGDRYHHAQGNYLPKPLTTSEGYYRYKYDNGNVVERSEDEIKSDAFPEVISQKKTELSEECEKAIIAGVDVGDAHYSLTIEDQANILALTPLAQAGHSVFYHQDGEMCREYSSDEFNEIVNVVTAHKTLQTTYCNLLMRQIEEMSDVEEVKAVEYGKTELIGKFKERYDAIAQHFVT
jgi:hypothetical protein